MAERCLAITGAASTAMLLRVINLLAVHDLPLRSLEAEMAQDDLRIRIGFLAPAEKPIDLVVERLRAFVEVSDVELC